MKNCVYFSNFTGYFMAKCHAAFLSNFWGMSDFLNTLLFDNSKAVCELFEIS